MSVTIGAALGWILVIAFFYTGTLVAAYRLGKRDGAKEAGAILMSIFAAGNATKQPIPMPSKSLDITGYKVGGTEN